MSDDAPHPPSRIAPLFVEPTSRVPGVEFVELVDGAFVHWHVHEVDAHEVPGARGAHCLLFVRDGVIRRVWDYPTDWRTLDTAALTLLSWQR